MDAAALAGSWRLISCEHRRTSDGAIEHPFGPAPIGRLVYLPDGRMIVLLTDPRRAKARSPQLFEAADAELAEFARGCVAYSGRWSLRGENVVHDVEESLFPNWAGATLTRSVQLDGDRLTLSTAAFTIRGVEYTAALVWEREP